MKDKKRILKQFHYWESDTFAQYLHNMSAKGWHFKGWKLGLIFEKGEPGDIDYAVEVFPKGSEMDTKPEPETEEYADYCEAAGWKLIDSRRKFCVFKKVRAGAVPIVTPGERLSNIRTAGLEQWLLNTIGIVMVTGMFLFEFLTQNFAQWIFFDLMMLILVAGMLDCIVKLIEGTAMFFSWHSKKKELQEGRIPFYGGKGQAVIRYLRNYLWFVEIGAYLLFSSKKGSEEIVVPLIVIIFFMLLFASALEMWRPSRENNWAVQIIASFGLVIVLVPILVAIVLSSEDEKTVLPKESIPLTQADYKEIPGQIIRTDKGDMSGMLGSMMYFEVEYGEKTGLEGEEKNVDTLWYFVYETRYSWILDKIWEQYVENAYEPQDCTADWEALDAFVGGSLGRLYTVRYRDRLLYMYSDEPLDKAQIQVVKNKLQL